jgi:hypothetical protein
MRSSGTSSHTRTPVNDGASGLNESTGARRRASASGRIVTDRDSCPTRSRSYSAATPFVNSSRFSDSSELTTATAREASSTCTVGAL